MQQQPRHLRVVGASSTRPTSTIFSYFSYGCIALILLTVFAACGTNSSSGSSNGKITITEMDYWSVASQSAVIQKLFTQYEKLHPNVTIQRTAVPFANLLPKADQEAASHSLPNILVLDNPDVAAFASTGALTQLDSFMQGKFSSSQFYAGPASTMTYQNKTYSFPVGSNDLALYYNMHMLKSAGLKPPTTWNELISDAQKLTHGNTYGFAFSAAADEEATFQFEPYLWANGGDLSHVDSQQSVAALQVLTTMVKNGSASKGVLNWGQTDAATQFGEEHAAIMENGPWELSVLEQQYKMKFGTDFGIVPLPVPSDGTAPVSPLGGEEWTIPASSNTASVQAAWDLVNWLQQPAQLQETDEQFGYIPAIKTAAAPIVQKTPELQVFANELNTARARTAQLGVKYPKVSQYIWTAEQSALSGSQTPQTALTQAQQQINTVIQ
jgi:multiple sugar transport system substrate-binding protein